jgi:L-threonylcarbamoyladenylate synthase
MVDPLPVLLRPGGISREQIEALIGPIAQQTTAASEAHPSPGMHPRHYSPRTKLLLVRDGEVPEQGSGAYLELSRAPGKEVLEVVHMPAAAAEYAACLYQTLHELDARGYDWIAVEAPPDTPEWQAVRDRLTRAAASTL